MACAGMTVVDSSGFPIYYEPPECAEEYRGNVETQGDNAVRVPDPKLVERPGHLPLAAVIMHPLPWRPSYAGDKQSCASCQST